ncbi:MAG: hypothetical protein LBB21_04775 [Holosporaceae bacterium]|jgi:hypothetical protein|nr:hypothetical protein [Holosporaceae bacterium]
MKRFLLLLLLTSFSVDASSKYLEIGDVEVKQAGSNSLVAKQEALSRAMLSAFRTLVETYTKERSSNVESISKHQVQNCVYDYSIDQEKFSDSVYIGKFSYRFYKRKVASLLQSYGIKIDFDYEEEKVARLAVYLDDFLRYSQEMRNLQVNVEKFSDEKVIFRINKDRINDFRKLRIRYAQLT